MVVSGLSASQRAAAAQQRATRRRLMAVSGLLLGALGVALVVTRDAGPSAEDLDCARRYAAARTAADSARVDAEFPRVPGRGRGTSRGLITLSCGARRQTAPGPGTAG